MARLPAPAATEKRDWEIASDDYALALGYLIREWNWLQDQLRDLFCALIEPIKYPVSAAIWYSIQNDRSQRAMLKAVAAQTFDSKLRWNKSRTDLVEKYLTEIEWIIERADAFGSQRDDAAHSPVSMRIGGPTPEIIAHHIHRNPRAQRLKDKAIVEEFKGLRLKVQAVSQYAHHVLTHFRSSRAPPLPRSVWAPPPSTFPPFPERPALLGVRPKKSTR